MPETPPYFVPEAQAPEPQAAGGTPDYFQEEAIPGQFPAEPGTTISRPRMFLPATGEMSTTYGGPPKPVASYAETAESLQEGTPLTSFIAPRQTPTESRIQVPKVPISKTDPFLIAAGKEVVNVAKSVPEFFTSDLGIASVIIGKLAPRLVTTAFAVDLAKSATQQAQQTVSGWSKMTPAEKATNLVDIVASSLFAIGTGRHALGKTETTIPRVVAPVAPPLPSTSEGYAPPGFQPITPTTQESEAPLERALTPSEVSNTVTGNETRELNKLQAGEQARPQSSEGAALVVVNPSASIAWLKSIEGGNQAEIGNATEKLLRQPMARGAEVGAEILDRADVGRASEGAPGDYGKTIGPEAQSERARPPQERKRIGQQPGQSGIDVSGPTQPGAQPAASRAVVATARLLQGLSDQRTSTSSARSLLRLLSQVALSENEKYQIVELIKTYARKIAISKGLGLRGEGGEVGTRTPLRQQGEVAPAQPQEAPPQVPQAQVAAPPVTETTFDPSRTGPLTAAAWKDPDTGQVYYGANHPEILTRLGKPVPPRSERNTPDFGYRTENTPFVPRDQAGPIAEAHDQKLETFDEGDTQPHADQVASKPGGSVPMGEAGGPTLKPAPPVPAGEPTDYSPADLAEYKRLGQVMAAATGPEKFDAWGQREKLKNKYQGFAPPEEQLKAAAAPAPEPPASPVLRKRTEIQSDLNDAKAELSATQKSVERLQQYLKVGQISKSRRAQLQAKLDDASARIERELYPRVETLQAERKAKEDALAAERAGGAKRLFTGARTMAKGAKAEEAAQKDLSGLVGGLKDYSKTRSRRLQMQQLKDGQSFPDAEGNTVTVTGARVNADGLTEEATLHIDDGTMFGRDVVVKPLEESGPGAVPKELWVKSVGKAKEAEAAPVAAPAPPRDWDLFYENLIGELDAFNPARESGRENYELNDVASRFVDFAKADKSGKTLLELVKDFAGEDEASKGQIKKLRQSVDSMMDREKASAPAPAKEDWQMTKAEYENGPPVKEGYVRLWRGESKTANPKPEELEGRWFTTSREVADFFASINPSSTDKYHMVYVDIPKADLPKYDAYNLPESQRPPIPDEQAYVLSPQLAATKRHWVDYNGPHSEQVAKALDEGKPVPADVLADFPDLKPQPALPAEQESMVKAAGDPFAVGKKIRFGNNPQPWTITRETTDPKFPDERLFMVKNDRTGEETETGVKGLTPITPRDVGEARKAAKRDLDAELRALRMDPSAFPDAKSKREAIRRAKEKGLEARPDEATPGVPVLGEEAIWNRLRDEHGIVPGGALSVETSDRTSWGWVEKGEAGKPARIVLNANTLRTPEQVDFTIQHELAHWYDLENFDWARKLQSTLSNAEWNGIFSRVVKSGYNQDSFGDEISARAIQSLATAWKGRSWFQKLVGTMQRFAAEKLGMKLSRLGAESIAARAIAQSIKGVSAAEMAAESKPAAGVLEAKPEEKETEPPKERPTRVYGADIGKFRSVEEIAPLVKRAKVVFDGEQPVQPDNTEQFWQYFNMVTKDPVSAGDLGSNIGGDAGLSLFQNEMWLYARRALARGDPSLFRQMVLQSSKFIIINPEGEMGRTAVGRAMRGLREGNDPFFQRMKLYTQQQLNSIGLKWKVGPDGMEQMIDAMSRLGEMVLQDPDALEQTIRTGDMQKILEGLTPERQDAQSIVDNSTFIPPEGRASIRETVYQWLKQPGDITDENRAAFIDSLTKELTSDKAGRARLNEEQARTIAEQTWNRKATSIGERAKRLLDSELNRLDKMPMRAAESFMRRMSGTEWKKPENPNNVRDIIAQAMKWRPKEGENVAPIGAQESDFIRDVSAKLVKEGVSETLAPQVAREIFQRRVDEWTTARRKAMERAAQSTSLRSLIESLQTSPYLAQQSPDWRLETAKNWFKSNGLPDDLAESAAKEFDKRFVDQMTAAAEKMAKSLMAKSPDPRTIPEVVQAIRLGLADPSKNWVDAISDRKGWFKAITPEQFKALAELEQKYSDIYLPPPMKVAYVEQMMGIMRHVGDEGGRFWQAMGENFAASLLSGIRTQTLHFFQPLVHTLGTYAIHSIFQPADFKMLTKSFLGAVSNWGPEFKFAWQKDAYTFNEKQMGLFHNELKRQFEIAERDWDEGKHLLTQGKSLEAGKKIASAIGRFTFSWQQFVIRGLMSFNQAGMAVIREWKLLLYGSMAMRAAKVSTKEIGQLVDSVTWWKNKLYDDMLEDGYSKNEARVIADYYVQDRVERFVAGTAARERSVAALEAALYDAYSVVGRKAPGVPEVDTGKAMAERNKRPDALESEGFLTRFSGMNRMMQYVSDMRKEGGGDSMLAIAMFGFMNVPFRLTRYYAGFGPYGLIRYGIWKYRTNKGYSNFWNQSYANDLMAKARFREAAIGTGLMLAFCAWQHFKHTSDDDAEKRPFAMFATGNGPSNKTLRDAWLKRGYQPYSLNVIVGGRVVARIPITRVGEILAYPLGIAAAQDDLAWKRKEDMAVGRQKHEGLVHEIAAGVGTYAAVIGNQGVLQAAQRAVQLSRGEANAGRAIATEAGSIIGGIIPGHGLTASLTEMLYGPIDRSSLEAATIANVPVLGAVINGKAVNRFGDTVGDRSWSARLTKTGIPVVIRVMDTQENKAMYQTLLDKGAAPPDLRRSLIEERYGPMTQDEWSKFVRASGATLKDLVLSNLDGLKTMDPQDVKSFLNRAGDVANQQAAAELALVPQKTTGRAEASTGGGGGGVAGALPGLPKVGLPTGLPGVGAGAGIRARAPGIVGALSGGGRGLRMGTGLRIGGGLGGGRAGGSRLRTGKPRRLVTGKLTARVGRGGMRKIRLSTGRKQRRIRYRA